MPNMPARKVEMLFAHLKWPAFTTPRWPAFAPPLTPSAASIARNAGADPLLTPALSIGGSTSASSIAMHGLSSIIIRLN
jgi:hypothetical protein